jgi:hypothetical protein
MVPSLTVLMVKRAKNFQILLNCIHPDVRSKMEIKKITPY